MDPAFTAVPGELMSRTAGISLSGMTGVTVDFQRFLEHSTKHWNRCAASSQIFNDGAYTVEVFQLSGIRSHPQILGNFLVKVLRFIKAGTDHLVYHQVAKYAAFWL